MAVINITEQIVERAVSEFVPKADYLQACYCYTPSRPVAKNSIVVVPFVTSSAATSFTAGTGYTTNNTDLNGVAVTLNQDVYSMVNIDDPSFDTMGEDAIIEAINNAQQRVLRSIASGALALVVSGSFPTVATLTTGNYAISGSSVVGEYEAKTIDWQGTKYVVANSTLLTALHAPSSVNRSSVIDYLKNSVLGYQVIGTSLTMPTLSGAQGFLCAKQHMAVVSGLKTPPPNTTTMYRALPVPGLPGVVLGFRRFYNDVVGQMQTVIEGTWGHVKLDGSALVLIK